MSVDSHIFPTKKKFFELAESGQRFPFVRKIKTDLLPWEAYGVMRESIQGSSALLESGQNGLSTGQFSIIAFNPYQTFSSKNKIQKLVSNDGVKKVFESDPFQIANDLFGFGLVEHPLDLPPFLGGAIGFFGYELKNQIEKSSYKVEDVYSLPDIQLAFFDHGFIYDHQKGEVYAFFTPTINEVTQKEFDDRFSSLNKFSESFPKDKPRKIDDGFQITFHENEINKDDFIEQVKKVKEYIRQGDVFQVNLSHCFEFNLSCDPYLLYKRQRKINPTNFAGFLDFGDYQLVCGSPERLVQKKKYQVQTRPIAGTRPRSKDKNLDLSYSKDLLLSPKERAEHVMLIDLERNDLGRVCEYGSVHVDELMSVEEYSHVRHIVSNVSGKIRSEKNVFDLIKAIFPGGTITGAPKVRSMEIIDELEGRARGLYTGSLGYIGYNQDCDLNIIIRSLLVKGKKAYLQVGAGIVADSDPVNEYQETLYKAQAFLEVLQLQEKELSKAL